MGFLKSAITSSLLLAASANAELDPIVRKVSPCLARPGLLCPY